MKKIGVQIFGTSVAVEKKGMKKVLKEIKNIGYDSVELCIIFGSQLPEIKQAMDFMSKKFNKDLPKSVITYDEAKALMPYLKEIDLKVVSVHAFAIGSVPGTAKLCMPELLDFAKEYGVKNYVVSYMLKDKEGCDDAKEDINYLVSELSKYGINLCYHNHETELLMVSETKNVMDYLFEICDDRLKIQYDTGWGVYAGIRVKEFVEKYNKRIVSVHLKDFCNGYKEMDRDDVFVAIGEGVVENLEIFNLLDKMDIIENGIIIDQDASKNDIMEDIKTGFKNVTL